MDATLYMSLIEQLPEDSALQVISYHIQMIGMQRISWVIRHLVCNEDLDGLVDSMPKLMHWCSIARGTSLSRCTGAS